MDVVANSSGGKTVFNDLIGVQKPEPEVDEIDGIVFQSFDSEESINVFTKFEDLEDEQRVRSSTPKTYRIRSLKSGKVIFPTKTKDITKIKGWREKLFSSGGDRHMKRPMSLCKPSMVSSNGLIGDHSMAQTSVSGTKSAFVSDLLDDYLKSKSDLRLNYLNPDFAPPPDDWPIYSATVLKMPDFNAKSMPPPPTPSPFKKKSSFSRAKELKNRLNLKTTFSSQSFGSLEDKEVSNLELLLPQYPVIRETLWPDLPLSDDFLIQLYNEYIAQTYNEIQLSKRPTVLAMIMDDHYARFSLGALQCNEPSMSFTENSNDSSDNVLLAVGLAPTPKPKPPPPKLSPLKESKITGRYRKDRDADLAKMIAMGNRSKRQIRLPTRFHESSLLMGNKWIIPDYDSKGKTGKRRLIEEQKRLQELLQKQRKQTVPSIDTTHGFQSNEMSLIQKKPKEKALNIPTVPIDYPLKIPHQRLKQMQLIRDRKNQMKKHKNESKLEKSFTSLYSMSQTMGDKRVLSLSAKAAASASQRAVVNQLFLQLSSTMTQDRPSMIGKNGKLNKLETLNEAIETIKKLNKREQQLSYIKRLLSMWNNKLILCLKVSNKNMKPEAQKVVKDVMNAYKDSICYKVGEALEAKRKELQEKRSHQVVKRPANPLANKCLVNSSQRISIPNTVHKSVQSFKMPLKSQKSSNERYILPKLSPQISSHFKSQKVLLANSYDSYPKLMTPDLHQKTVKDISVVSKLNSKECSLLKPPILTTRPTVLKPFIMPSKEVLHSSTSVTGPVINIPNISRIKSMSKSMASYSSSLIASNKARSTPKNKSPLKSYSKLKLSPNKRKAHSLPTSSTPVGAVKSQSQPKTAGIYSPHSYGNKSVIITSETPLANEDLTKIVASITANPERFKKVPVRLTNGMTAITIPGSIDFASTSNQKSSSTVTLNTKTGMIKNKTNVDCFDVNDNSKAQKSQKSQSCLTQRNGSKHMAEKQTISDLSKPSMSSQNNDFIEIN